MGNKNRFDHLPWTPRIERMPRDKRGYPVPFVVAGRGSDSPDFIVNDQLAVLRCYTEGLCSICGEKMPDNDVWALGGLRSAYHPCGAYIDPPVHRECGAFALQICPWLALPKYTQMADEAKQKKVESALEKNGFAMAVDPTLDPNKPDCFVMARIDGYLLTANAQNTGYYILPMRPMQEAEEWADGECLARLDMTGVRKRMREHRRQMFETEGLKLEHLPEETQLRWKGKLGAGFPWHFTPDTVAHQTA